MWEWEVFFRGVAADARLEIPLIRANAPVRESEVATFITLAERFADEYTQKPTPKMWILDNELPCFSTVAIACAIQRFDDKPIRAYRKVLQYDTSRRVSMAGADAARGMRNSGGFSRSAGLCASAVEAQRYVTCPRTEMIEATMSAAHSHDRPNNAPCPPPLAPRPSPLATRHSPLAPPLFCALTFRGGSCRIPYHSGEGRGARGD